MFLIIPLLISSMLPVKADAHTLGYVPYWDNGTLTSVAPPYGPDFSPVPWPDQNGWDAYTWEALPLHDPRVLDPSNGGTRPQNYVNVSSGCPDQSLPSIYIAYDTADQIFFFRWRVEQIPNTYATGPAPSAFSDVDPWKAAQWTVLLDTDGDGYREFGMQLDGSTGMPAYPVDILRTIYSNTLSQNMDPHDRGIYEIYHNGTAFVDGTGPGDTTNLILNFHNADSPDTNWPNGSAETVWDYGTTRSIDVTYYDPLLEPPAHQCSQDNENEYFVDYQIPLGMMGDTSYNFDCTNPAGLFFATANSLTNPFQKDVVSDGSLLATPDECVPFGDLVVLCGPNGPEIIPQPVVDSVRASSSGCTTELTAQVRGAITGTSCDTNVTGANFYYYYDANGNGQADDGSTWTLIGAGTQSTTDPRQWTYTWDTAGSGLQAGSYLIGIEAINTTNGGTEHYRTWSFLQTVTSGSTALPDGSTATDYDKVNPDNPGVVNGSTLLDSSCGETVVVDKAVTPDLVATNENVQFTITVHNNTGSSVHVNSVTDRLPSVAASSPAQYFSYVSTDGGTLSPGTPVVSTTTLTWSFSPAVSITAGGTGTIIFTAKAPNTGGTYENTCSSNVDVTSWGETDRNISCNYVEIGVGAPDLTISKSADVAFAAPGDAINYTVAYSNNSPANVTGAYITDELPLGLTFVSAADGGSYDPGTNTITWNVGDLPAGSGPFAVSFVATVTTPFPELALTRLLNTATIYSNETPPKSANVTVDITGVDRPLLTIQKKGNKTFIDPTSNTASDRQVTYTITFSNVGNAAATNTTITDPIPAGWTYDSSAAGANCPAGTTTGNPVTSVTWNIGTLAAGASGSCNLVLEAKDSSSQPYAGENPSTNTATIRADGVSPVSSSYSVGLTGATMSCPGQTYYFHRQYLDPPSDTMKLANITVPDSSVEADAIHVTVFSNGCPSMSPVTDFYQDPPLANNGSLTPLTSQWYTEKQNGNPTNMVASVYDYDPETGTETFLGSQTVKYTGADQQPYLNKTTIIPLHAPVAGHRLHWTYEACTVANNSNIDLYYLYDGTRTEGSKTYYVPSHFCYQGTSVVLNKTVDKINAFPGDALTYTINFGNNGGIDLTGAHIIDTLPEGVDFVSAALNGVSESCARSGQVLTCDVNSNDNPGAGIITVDQQGTLVITVQLQNPFPSGIYTLLNTSELVTNEAEPVYSSATTAVATNITIMKTVDKSLLYPGDTATYTLTILNSSGSAMTVDVTDALQWEDYYDYIANSASPASGFSYDSAAHTLSWTGQTVPANGSATFTFQMQVTNTTDPNPPPLGTTYKDNTGVVTYGSQQYSNRVRVTILNGANLDITKAVDSSIAAAGDTRTFTMTVTNAGSQDALDVMVTDPVPDYMTYKAGTIYYGTTNPLTFQTDANDADNAYFDPIGNRVVYSVGALPGGESRTMSFSAVVDRPMPDGTTTIINTATASSSNTASKKATATVDVTDSPSFTLDKYAPDVVASGQNFIFTIYYRNTGGSTATSAVVTDMLAGGLMFVSADKGGTYDNGSGVVTWNLGDLAPGAEGALHLTVSSATCGTYSNAATIISNEIAAGVVSNEGTPTSTVVCGLQPDKSTSTPKVTNSTTGTTATYTITVTNPTGITATDVQVTDNFSSGFTYDGGTTPVFGGSGNTRTSQVDPTTGDNHPTWGTWNIDPGGTLTIQFNAKVDGSVPAGTYQNNVACTSSNATCLAFDELSTTAEDVTVAVPVNLTVTKVVDNTTPSGTGPGAEFVYTITIANTDPAYKNHAFSVTLNDILPSEVSYDSSSASQGTYDNTTGVWDVGRIGYGESATLTIDAYPNEGTGGIAIQNCADLASVYPPQFDGSNNSVLDQNLNDNESCVTVTPTEVTLSGFDGYAENGKVVVEWDTASEHNTVGFYLYRYDAKKGQYAKVGSDLLPAFIGSEAGGTYRLIDKSAVPSGEQLYKLVEVRNKGGSLIYGPFTVDLGGSAGDVVKKFSSDGTIEITIKGDVATKVRSASRASDSGFQQVTDTFSRKADGMSAAEAARLEVAKQEQEKTKAQKQTRQGSALKISVLSEGVYYIDASDIAAKLNIPVKSVPQLIKTGNISLSSKDGQVSYTPADGNTGLIFFGQAINSIYTDENIYWLNVARGALMDAVDDSRAHLKGSVNDAFTETLHMEQNLTPGTGVTTNPESDYWYWDYVFAGIPGLDTKDFHFTAYSVSTMPGMATITARLQGMTDTNANPDHHAVILLNGQPAGEGKWNGVAPYTIVANVNQSLLGDGDNTIEVKAMLGPGVPYSLFYINSFDVTYARKYEVVNDYLRFKADGSSVITVGGFSTSSISVFNITDPMKPEVVTPASIDWRDGNYSLKFYPDDANAEYIAFTPSAVTQGDSAAALASDLKDKSNAADYIVIAPEELRDAARMLADYRQSKNMKTMVVSLESIMDEFNYGMYDPGAIKKFLQYAYSNWKTKPSYGVLVGAGTYDYRNVEGYGGNFIPPLMVGTPWGLVPSDNVLGDFNGDNVPEVIVGRIPVVSDAEMQAVLDKMKSFEGNSIDGIMMLADKPDGGGNFPQDSCDIAQIFATHPVEEIYLSDYSLDQARSLLFEGLNRGTAFVNFMGHGGIDRLTQGGLLVTGDVAGLSNSQYPVLTALTCAVGQFAFPGYESLTDALIVKKGGGVVSSWAPSGYSLNADAKILGEGFYTAVFQSKVATFGDAVARAMAGYQARGKLSFILNSFNIIGDPALRIK